MAPWEFPLPPGEGWGLPAIALATAGQGGPPGIRSSFPSRLPIRAWGRWGCRHERSVFHPGASGLPRAPQNRAPDMTEAEILLFLVKCVPALLAAFVFLHLLCDEYVRTLDCLGVKRSGPAGLRRGKTCARCPVGSIRNRRPENDPPSR